MAVDISVDFLRQALHALQREHPALELVGVGLDFSERLQLPADLCAGPALVFYPGSSIGNFAPDAALRLLRQAREVAAGGALLIGVDLVKPTALLEAAYDDELGVTAAFNLNLLKHLNRLLGADFAVRDWRHVALFDAAQSRIEMHLEARRATHRALARRRTCVHRRRAHAHRELLQVDGRELRRTAARRRLLQRAALERPPGLVRRVPGRWLSSALGAWRLCRRPRARPYSAQLRKPAGTSLRCGRKKLR